MRAAADRISTFLVGWVPDLSRFPTRRLVTVGVVVSLFLHLLGAAGYLAVSFFFPPRDEPVAMVQKPNLEVEIIQPKPSREAAMIEEPRTRSILDPRGLTASLEKPADAKFESSQDMRAGSESAPTGQLPLPSQEGRTDRMTDDFTTQDVQIGLAPTPQPVQPAPRDPAPESAPPPRALPPLYTPQPVSKEALASAQQAPDRPLPEPAKVARATPPPLDKAVTLRPDQIAVAAPDDKAAPAPLLQPPPKHTPPTPAPSQKWMAMLSTPRPLPVQSARERYQQSLEKTRVEGAIAKRGAAGVDAVATPAGRWTKQVNDALGYNWNLFMKQSAEMISTGSVRITFAVDAEGKVHDLHADSTSGTASLRQICEMAVRRTVIPVPPPDLLQSFPDHKVDYTINFNYY